MTEVRSAGETRRDTVLVFAHSSGMAGAERSLLETMQLLVAGYDVEVVVPWRGPFTDAVCALPVARVHTVHQHSWYQEPGRSRWKKLAKAVLALSAVARSVLLLARTRPDLVYSNTIASWTGAIAARIARVPHVWHLRELPRADLLGLPIFGRGLERWILADPRTVPVCNSAFVREWYQQHFGRAPLVAYQPVKLPDAPAARTAPPVSLAIFGRIHPSKGQLVAVEALARLDAARRQSIVLHVHGESLEPYASQLREAIARHGLQDHVRLHGFTARPHDAMANCDLVVVAATDEPFGRVCVEAMLLGVPVLGSDSGGTLELIGPEEQRGTLFRTADAQALAERIDAFLDDPRLFRARAEAAGAWARQAFSDDAYLATLHSAFAAATAAWKNAGALDSRLRGNDDSS